MRLIYEYGIRQCSNVIFYDLGGEIINKGAKSKIGHGGQKSVDSYLKGSHKSFLA